MALTQDEREWRENVKAAIRTRYGSVFRFEDAFDLPRKSASDVLRGRTNKSVSDAFAKVLPPEMARQSDKSDSSNECRAHRQSAEAR
ncbi:hypothetical protein [Sphingomonas hengshuiensis]|uniref:Ner winged helix-turn-helix DNA-binding domain-containing protein n=1 Tax=Sphingomonas hengshuiensis TaxID=1609977 RepID=A0A7U4JAB4_9SPHN|nr:hypothetical protein [Sphingomonas hengshuiensis]AJP73141.1 hypothetical protein TS85_17095 [Sphingomonas hengshuiensis]